MTSALVTCSGVPDTGKLTTQAALTLLRRKPGQYIGIYAKQSTATLEAEIGDAEQVIVIDGCTDCCAKKKLSASCLAPHHHIIATELGIEKMGMGAKCSTMRSRKWSGPSWITGINCYDESTV